MNDQQRAEVKNLETQLAAFTKTFLEWQAKLGELRLQADQLRTDADRLQRNECGQGNNYAAERSLSRTCVELDTFIDELSYYANTASLDEAIKQLRNARA